VKLEVLPDAAAVAARAAAILAEAARAAVAARGRFALAVSGGRTPWIMLRTLAAEAVPWEAVHLFQVDERVAPPGHADRNLVHLRESLGADPRTARCAVHPMPVDDPDLAAAAARYAAELRAVAGDPPVLDLVHLGLGADGHTASLVPGDAALRVDDAEVALAGPYQGRARMTLTFPVLDRARRVLWVVTGADKAPVLPRLLAGDRSIPAGRVRTDGALLLADAAAAPSLATAP
jgi:6-phosphogluconolactonase